MTPYKKETPRALFSSSSLLLLVGIAVVLTIPVITTRNDRSQNTPSHLPIAGDATVRADNANAFAQPLPTLSDEERRMFQVGNSFFNDNWVIAPASTTARDGLGPTFNARSCSGCHLRDGRADPGTSTETADGLLFRVSLPGTDETGAPAAVPGYGTQINPHGIAGVDGEATVRVSFTPIQGTFTDGTAYELTKPTYTIDLGNYGPLPAETQISPRLAQQVPGLGLLEAIPAADILNATDPNDTNGDGISGRANTVWDATTQTNALGRFGWKANQPSLRQQTAGAFLGDIGITSSLFPTQNCEADQQACLAAPTGGNPELEEERFDRVVFYLQTLGVPTRRDPENPQVVAGEELFTQIGCSDCHTPQQQTGSSDSIQQLNGQTIFPYTDLLLHDMGAGLADNRPDFLATGTEWRTPPLWGIGMIETVNGHTRFLHDGRANNLSEAILWHGGEAASAQQQFLALNHTEREQLLAFLKDL